MRIANVLRLCAALGLGLLAPAAGAQTYPAKPVRIITPFAPGSGPDSALRVVGQKLTGLWGQQVIIENRPGGNGFIALEAAKRSPADGYTLVQMDDTHMSLLPYLYRRIPYDVAKDFDPVAGLFRTYFFVVVPSGSPWRNVGDLVAAAKAKPGEVNYGSWFVGSPGHLGAAMLEGVTGIRMTHIPYKAQSDLFTAVANGDVAWAFGTAGSSGAMYRAGKVRYVAISAPQRVEGYADVPTVAEAGGPAIDLKSWVALFAPKGTPQPIIAKINESMAEVLADPEVRERFAALGYETYTATPAEMTREREADLTRYGEIVKTANISIE